MNALAGLAAVSASGADVVRAAAQLASLKPLKGRGERHEIVTPQCAFRLIDDSYNANPTSMRAAFEVLGRTTVGDGDRTSGVEGKRVSVRVDLGGRRIIKKKKKHTEQPKIKENNKAHERRN